MKINAKIPLRGLLGLCLILVIVLALPAEDARSPEDWVRDLNHPKFGERAKASQELEKLGVKALPALEAAAKDENPEVARRAAEVIELIRKKAETEQVMKPTLVTVECVESPVAQVIKDLAKQTGFSLELAPTADAARKISVKLREVPFWQALDEICERADLIVKAQPVLAQKNEPPQLGLQRLQQPGVQVQVAPGIPFGDSQENAPVDLPIIRLEAGKPLAGPVAYVGAFAIRALPLGEAENENIREHFGVLLEVRPEPRMTWRSPADIRLEVLKDDKGQEIAVVSSELTNQGTSEDKDEPSNANVAPLPFNQQLLVLLRPPANPSGSIPELKAVVSGKVQGARRAVLTLEELAAGKSVRTSAGEELTLHSFKVDEDGEVTMDVELKSLDSGLGAAGNRQVVFQGQVQIQMGGNFRGGRLRRMSLGGGINEIQLYDNQGKPYELSIMSMNVSSQGGESVKRVTLHGAAPMAKSKPARLCYESSKPFTFELPFTLKQIQLP